MTNRKKYKISLIEPSDIVCAGLKTLLGPSDEFDLVSITADARRRAARPLPP